MTQSADPFTNPQDWDYVIIGGVKSPGICKVSGFSRKNEWDLKKGKGTIGATLTFVGKPPAKGKIVWQIWTSEQYESWISFRQLLKYDPTKKSVTAIDIYYPSLDDIDIHSVVCEDLGQLEHQGNQLYTIEAEFIEYFPPPKKSAVSTPGGSKSTSSKTKTPGTQPDPIGDAQQAEIAKLLKEAKEP